MSDGCFFNFAGQPRGNGVTFETDPANCFSLSYLQTFFARPAPEP